MDILGKRYIVGNLFNDTDDDLSDRQVRCKDSSSVEVAKRAQENGDAEKWNIHSEPPYDPEDPGAMPEKIWFESVKYDSPEKCYLGRNSNVANLQTDLTYFIPTPIEGEDDCYLLSLHDEPLTYLTMEDPHDTKEIMFKSIPLEGSDPAPKPKHKWIFVKADGLQSENPNA